MDLSAYISERIASGRKLLAPYLCAGFPEPSATLPLLEALADAGADLIELGLPFSDPMADGPVLQAASLQALRQGMNLERTLEVAAAFIQKRPDVPLLLMGYVNPLLAMGKDRFVQKVQAAGISALLIPDLPPECAEMIQASRFPPLVSFAAPNTSDARLQALGKHGGPFLYAISVLGVTGARNSLDPALPAFLARAKAQSGLPVFAGFGISDPSQATVLAEACDGIVLGSALAEALNGADLDRLPEAAQAFLTPFRKALDAVEASCC